MIREVAMELSDLLKAQGVPYPVVVGPMQAQPVSWGRSRIVLEYGSSDAFTRPRSVSINPKIRFIRQVAAELTIYVESPSMGALPSEHNVLAEEVLDHVLVQLDHVFAVRKVGWSISNGGFIEVDDLKGSEIQRGAAYRLSFSFERAVSERKWSGAITPEFSIISGGLGSSTRVTIEGPTTSPNYPDPETSCGG